VADPTTYADALAILRRRDLLDAVPESVRSLLRSGVRGEVQETVKAGDAESARSCAVVIGSNRIALQAAAAHAEGEGFDVVRLDPPLEGDTRAAAERCADRLLALAAKRRASGRRICALAGGETTVQVTGSGKGGRNQEFALALMLRLEGRPISLLSAGSDGIDGPTDAAGAFVDGASMAEARRRGLDPDRALAANDSYGFFAATGGLFQPGPTGTNVADLKLALIG
jgi:hydroxypyruvate reductase